MTSTTHSRRRGSRATRTPGAPRVFFSYRRSDSTEVTTHLVDKIRHDIGSENVFRDSDDLIAGTRWQDSLDEAIDTCDAAVFVVGPEWHGPVDDGGFRITDPDDPVAAEVSRATDPNATCTPIPVLVDMTGPPPDLPPTVAPLFERHAISSSRADLVDTPTKAYQGVLIGVWESIRRRTPDGVLVIGDEDASAHLDEVIAEMKESKLIDARRLSRFAAGACVVSARRIRKGARKWPDAIVVADDSDPSPVLTSRLRALEEHPGIRNVSLIGAGFAIGQVLGTATGAATNTTFTAASQLAPAVPQIGAGPLGALSSVWVHAGVAAKAAVEVAVAATVGTAAVAVSPFGSEGTAGAAQYGYLDVEMGTPRTTDDVPDDWLVEGTDYVRADLALENLLRDDELSVPAGIFTLFADGQRAEGWFEEGGPVVIPPQGSLEATLWWTIPDGTSLSESDIEIREVGTESLVLSTTDDLPASVPLEMERDIDGYRGVVEFSNDVASYNAPPGERGEKPPNPGYSPLGRAPEGEILIVFDVVATTQSGHFTEIANDVYNHVTGVRTGDYELRISHSVPRQWGPRPRRGGLPSPSRKGPPNLSNSTTNLPTTKNRPRQCWST